MRDVRFYADIVLGHRARMQNIMKYYPFFMITKDGFPGERTGIYEKLDMGYLVMAVLRFFIEKNNFEGCDVTYPEYVAFLKDVILNDFDPSCDDMVLKEVADCVFDKMRNDGRPFAFEYYDPTDGKKRSVRLRFIESNISENTVYYSIAKEALEFYLDTKEIRDESKISIEQLLLEKMITARDFSGGTEVIKRINDEVFYLKKEKDEVKRLLGRDIMSGIREYESFKTKGIKWFLDEQKLFQKNMALIKEIRNKMTGSEDYSSKLGQLYELESELDLAMHNHLNLLTECTSLSIEVDEAIKRYKLKSLSNQFDFDRVFEVLKDEPDASKLGSFIYPFLRPAIKKSFSFEYVRRMFDMEEREEEKAEKIERNDEVDVTFADELEEARIKDNYRHLFSLIILLLKTKDEFDLVYFKEACEKLFGEAILKNGDFYSFLVNLMQKREYGRHDEKPDTFLDEILKDVDFEGVMFGMEPCEGKELETFEGFYAGNVIFKRIKE